jgi:hypothetical protein
MQASRFFFGYREGARATRMLRVLSTANLGRRKISPACSAITILQRGVRIRAPIAAANGDGTRIKGMGMTEQQDNAAAERKEIAARIASFKATQQKFAREREEYFFTTLENAIHSHDARHAFERPPFWS